MLNRRSFCIRSAASVAAAVTLTGTVEAKEVASALKGSAAKAGSPAAIPMDEAQARSLILEAYRKLYGFTPPGWSKTFFVKTTRRSPKAWRPCR